MIATGSSAVVNFILIMVLGKEYIRETGAQAYSVG